MSGYIGGEVSSESSMDNLLEFALKPRLVSETPVFDLAGARLKHAESVQLEVVAASPEPSCKDGVCVLNWKPRRPQGDVA